VARKSVPLTSYVNGSGERYRENYKIMATGCSAAAVEDRRLTIFRDGTGPFACAPANSGE